MTLLCIHPKPPWGPGRGSLLCSLEKPISTYLLIAQVASIVTYVSIMNELPVDVRSMADADQMCDLVCSIYYHLLSCYHTCLSPTVEKMAKERLFPNILLQPWIPACLMAGNATLCSVIENCAPSVLMLPELVSPAVARMLLFVMSIPFASNPPISWL